MKPSLYFNIYFEDGTMDSATNGRELWQLAMAGGLVRRINIVRVDNTGPTVDLPATVGIIEGLGACEVFIGMVSR